MMDLLSARRQMRVVWPRWVAMYLARHLTMQSLPSIGRRIGDRDHTTVINGLKRVDTALQTDEKLAHDISVLTERIKNGSKARLIAANENRPSCPKFRVIHRDIEPRERWPAELAETLRAMWERGDEVADIAKATGRTPAGVIGKAWRMKLTKRQLGTVLPYNVVRQREFRA